MKVNFKNEYDVVFNPVFKGYNGAVAKVNIHSPSTAFTTQRYACNQLVEQHDTCDELKCIGVVSTCINIKRLQ